MTIEPVRLSRWVVPVFPSSSSSSFPGANPRHVYHEGVGNKWINEICFRPSWQNHLRTDLLSSSSSFWEKKKAGIIFPTTKARDFVSRQRRPDERKKRLPLHRLICINRDDATTAGASHFANYSLSRYRPRNTEEAEIFMAVINPTSPASSYKWLLVAENYCLAALYTGCPGSSRLLLRRRGRLFSPTRNRSFFRPAEKRRDSFAFHVKVSPPIYQSKKVNKLSKKGVRFLHACLYKIIITTLLFLRSSTFDRCRRTGNYALQQRSNSSKKWTNE